MNWSLSEEAPALLITDKAAAEVRPTYDVDAIGEISSYAVYAEFFTWIMALEPAWYVPVEIPDESVKSSAAKFIS